MSQILLDEIHVPPAERLAINASDDSTAARILCTSVGRGQTAAALARRLPGSAVVCNFLDIYPTEDARHLAAIPNLEWTCRAELPDGPRDLCVIPVSRGGEAELTRDWLQQGFDRLEIGGVLIAAVDNPKDTWLHHELEKLGKSLGRTPKRHGVVYRLKKQEPLKRLRDFGHEFAFRDAERLIKLFSRPGVFSHRKLDTGARALIETMHIHHGDHVLDIGCGSGAVGISAAFRAEGVSVHAIDSNVRAVECAQRGAALNGLPDYSTCLTADGELTGDGVDRTGTFDIALGNPPYFSHYQIAEIFLQTARRGLKPGGRVVMVTKHEEWLTARMKQLFDDVSAQEVRAYAVVSGVQKS